jgi:zinc protease
VLRRQLATEIGTDEAPGELYPSLFVLEATPKTGVDSHKLRDLIQKELDRLGREGFSAKDIEYAKKRVRTQFLSAFDSNSEIAGILGRSELLYKNWDEIIKMYDLMLKVTNDDLKRLINSYLKTDNRTTGFIERANR